METAGSRRGSHCCEEHGDRSGGELQSVAAQRPRGMGEDDGLPRGPPFQAISIHFDPFQCFSELKTCLSVPFCRCFKCVC